MFGIEVFIRRNVPNHVQVNSLRRDAMIKEQLIILQQVTQPVAIIQISLTAAIPVAHHGNVAVFRIAKPAARKRLRRQSGVLFADCKLGIIRGSIEIVVAVLIVKNIRIAKLARRIHQALESFPASGLFRRRQGIGMLSIVTKMGPTGNEDQHVIEAARLQVAELFRSLIKCRQAVIL